MIGDASSHCRCGLATGLGQTRVRCAAVIDRPDQIHAMLQGQRAVRERLASARQRRQTLTERRMQPLDAVWTTLTLRAPPERLDACRRAIDNAACGLDPRRRS